MGTASNLQMYANMDEGDMSLELGMKIAGSLSAETVHIYVQLMHC